MSDFELGVELSKSLVEIRPLLWDKTADIRINYQLDAIVYLFTLARHVSGLYVHLQEQWML
jgi:hypothetical protein